MFEQQTLGGYRWANTSSSLHTVLSLQHFKSEYDVLACACFYWNNVMCFLTFCVISSKVWAITCLWALVRLVRILTTVTASEPGAQCHITIFNHGRDGRVRIGTASSKTAKTTFVSRGTFVLQRCADLPCILLRVEVGERSHRSKGSPTHVLRDEQEEERRGKQTFVKIQKQ